MQIKKMPTTIIIKLKKPRKKKSPEEVLYHSAKARAKEKNLPFSISLKDVFIPPYCPVLGYPILCGGSWSDFSPSLDRFIPEKGYVPGNVMVMSFRANRFKNDATIEELEKVLNYCKKVKKVLDKR